MKTAIGLIAIAIVAIALMVAFSGCIDKGPEGRYVLLHDLYPEEYVYYIEIRADGTFLEQGGGPEYVFMGTWEWEYEEEGDEICLIPYDEHRSIWCYTVTKNALIHTPSGDEWRKEELVPPEFRPKPEESYKENLPSKQKREPEEQKEQKRKWFGIKKGAEGKYVHSVGKYGNEWIELKDNNVWRYGASWKDPISIGTWRREGDLICFITAGEEEKDEACVTFTENALVIEGEKWTKEELAPAKTYSTNPVGKYKDEYGDYIEIKKDGTYVIFEQSQYFTGTWEQKEQEWPKIKIQLTFREDGYEEKVYVILIENILVDQLGDMWFKEE